MNATTTAPANWRIHQSTTPTYAGGTGTLSFQASSGSPTTGGSYNWGTTAGTDRALGVMTSGSYASPNSVMGFFRNTNASNLTQLAVSYNLERYRLNTASASVQFFYSTDGSTWVSVSAGDITAATIGTGASTYSFAPQATFSVASFNITGLNIATNSDIYLRWNLNTTGSNSQGIGIDDVSVTASFTACSPSPEPTTQASSIVVSPGCFTAAVNLSRGNGEKILAVLSTDCTISDPADQVNYNANITFGSGSTTGPGDFVVYNGTASNFTISGLNTSTSYCLKIYEYNGTVANCEENYMLSSSATLTFSTLSSGCIQPHLTGVMINACVSGSCSEGDNEIVYGTAGDFSFVANSTNLVLRYDATSPASTTYTDALTTNATTTSALNTASGCAGTFVEGTGATIPIGGKFMIVDNNFCPGAYDWTQFCGNGPVYVIYSTDASWNSTGNFGNDPGATSIRHFRTTITTTSSTTNTIDYNYNTASLFPYEDGDYVLFDADGGEATAYGNNSCVVDPILLPVVWGKFEVNTDKNRVLIAWSTLSERNSDYFDIEIANEFGQDFEKIGRIKGAGTSSSLNEYQFEKNEIPEGYYYFRIKQVDFDGKFTYSETKALSITGDHLAIKNIQKTSPYKVTFNEDIPRGSRIHLFDLTGKLLYQEELTNDTPEIKINGYFKGLLLLKVENKFSEAKTFRILFE